jgi:hypothetical protein
MGVRASEVSLTGTRWHLWRDVCLRSGNDAIVPLSLRGPCRWQDC